MTPHTKFVFVTGGVCSSLGKGIIASSIGALLELRGLKVSLTKADPYLNIDPGTMNPFQHGEVFVTDDGAETDLDIGHYERFTSANITKLNSFSTGQVYDAVLNKERKGDYLGKTVQVVPHITSQIKENIYKASQNVDISIIEIGGTVGDIESLPFLEAIRQINIDIGSGNVLFVHLTLVPYLESSHELKTKPTQHSVKELRQIGIQPHILICRSSKSIPKNLKEKIALFCNVDNHCVIEALDLDNIYKIPIFLNAQDLDQIIVNALNIWARTPNLSKWKNIKNKIENPKHKTNIAIVGKYTGVLDSYKSITEALIHAGIENDAKVNIEYIDANKLKEDNIDQSLSKFDGVIVPGGFGHKGIEGKILAINYVRKKSKPFLGICLGMHLAVIEFARNVLNIKDASSFEFDNKSKNLVIDLMESQHSVVNKGATMRLGAYECMVKNGSKLHKIYNHLKISERHRHRYEFNNHYREEFEKNGFLISGLSPDKKLVEIIELKDHPWFIAVQFHPELKSSPLRAHPLFKDFVLNTI